MKRVTRAVSFLVCIAGQLVAVAGEAGDRGWTPEPFEAPAAEVLAAANARERPVGEDNEVLLREVRWTFDRAGRGTKVSTLVHRFLNQAGLEGWASVEAPWDPWRQARPEIDARVIAPDGTVFRLDPATVSEGPVSTGSDDLYDDRKVIRAPMPGATAGAVAEERVVSVGIVPELAGIVKEAFYPVAGAATRHARLVVELPEELDFRWRLRDLEGVEPRIEVVDGTRRFVVELFDVPADDAEDREVDLPPEVPRWPSVVFSIGGSWAAVSREYDALVESRVSGSALETEVETISSAGADREARIAAALRAVHEEVRYAGLEFGEASIVPYSPQETLARKYGDCKDQATLLVALLRAVGVPAHVALLRTGPGEDIEPDLAGLRGFNHAIVVAPGEPELWIDPTDRYAPAGRLPMPDQGRLTLVIASDTTALSRTPMSTSADNGEIEERVFELLPNGPARVTSTTTTRGASDTSYRWSYASVDGDEEAKERVKGWVKSEFLADAVGNVEFSDPGDLSEPFTLRIEVPEAKRGVTQLEDAAAAIRLDSMLDQLPDALTDDDETQRKGDFEIWEPFFVEWRYRITPPAGFSAAQLPPSGDRELGSAHFEERYEVTDDNAVTAVLRLESGPTRLDPETFAATRKAVHELADRGPVIINFSHDGQRLLAEGRVAEAVAVMKALSEREPDVAPHHIRLANALLAAGLGEAARAEARRAVEVDPSSADAQRTLGWCLEHDVIGRRFGSGWDRAGALTAYRKVREQPEPEFTTWVSLAILLEHDEEGDRYSEEADLDDAITEYRAMLETHDNAALEHNLMVALLRGGRFDEILAEGRVEGADVKQDAVRIAATAATTGPGEGVSKAEPYLRDPVKRREVLAGAGQLLLQIRRYPEAAALFRAAAQGNTNASALIALASRLEGTRRWDEVELDPEEPSTIVKRLMVKMVLRGTEKADIAGLLAKSARAQVEEEDGDIEVAMRALRNLSATSGVPLETFADLMIGLPQYSVSGSRSPVRRVQVEGSSNDVGTFSFAFYVVREEGRWLVLSATGETSPLAKLALSCADSGDVAGARELIEWARSESFSGDPDDPLGDAPMRLAWPRGGITGVEDVRLLALLALASGPEPAAAAAELESLREAADERQQMAIDAALLRAAVEEGDDEGEIVRARRMLEAEPDSQWVFWLLGTSLIKAERFDELETACSARLERHPNEPFALRLLSMSAANRGNYESAVGWLEKLQASGGITGPDLNNIAWLALFAERSDAQKLTWASEAAQRTGYSSYPTLHTLASAFAEAGRPVEAYAAIRKGLDVGAREPDGDDWFVFGRMAEEYGFPELAAEYYERTLAGEGADDPQSTAVLARRRMAGLGHGGQDGAGDATQVTGAPGQSRP